MKPIMRPTRGPDEWREFLAEPEKQWKPGYSAHALAHTWEAAPGFPPRVAAVLSGDARFRNLELLVAVPECRVPLPGGARPSQTDLWVLARGSDGLVSIAVEGKVSESFGPTVGDWHRDSSPGKSERLAYLSGLLQLPAAPDAGLRYQLIHRTASAIILARRFQAPHAVMLVHSFSPSREWLDDYLEFAKALGGSGASDSTVPLPGFSDPSLTLAWVSDRVPHV